MPISERFASNPTGHLGQQRAHRAGAVLDLCAIEASLRDVQAQFPRINTILKSPRDRMDDAIVENMLAGYAAVDDLLARKVDLFSVANLRQFLELNATVLCGVNPQTRAEAAQHLAATEKHFYDEKDGGIRDIIEWYEMHAREGAVLRAAGVYIRILSEPQLFIEGNHRTGALIMSYILARAGHPPFVLTVDNAHAYFDPSTLITKKKKKSLTLLFEMPRLKRNFAAFLTAQADARYLQAKA
jgi:hypothetical protein